MKVVQLFGKKVSDDVDRRVSNRNFVPLFLPHGAPGTDLRERVCNCSVWSFSKSKKTCAAPHFVLIKRYRKDDSNYGLLKHIRKNYDCE